MTGYERVFIDTAPVIYYLEDNDVYGKRTLSIFDEILKKNKQIVTSSLTCMEYLVHPYRRNDRKEIDGFFS